MFYDSALVWSLVCFFSWLGYGSLIHHLYLRESFKEIQWGLKCCIGLSASLILSSILLMFKTANSVALTGVVFLGLCCLLVTISLKNSSNSQQRNFTSFKKNLEYFKFDPWLIVPGSLVFLTFITSVNWPYQVDVNDDWIAYLSLPEKLLQTGDIDEPFSQRRVVALCGQSILQAMLMIVVEPENCHILDRGLACLLLFGLLNEITSKGNSHTGFIRCLVVSLPLLVSVPRINTASYQLGVTLCLAAIYAFRIILAKKNWNTLEIVVVASLLAALASLRSTFAIWGGTIFILFFTFHGLTTKNDFRRSIFTLFKLGFFTIVLLFPLMISSYASSGTPLFPLFNGNLNSDVAFAISGKSIEYDILRALEISLNPLILVMLFNFLAVIFLNKKDKILAICFIVSSLVVYSLSVFKQSGAEFYDVYRYSYPILATPLYWILSVGLSNHSQSDKNYSKFIFGLCVAIVLSGHLQTASYEKQAEIKQFLLYKEENKKFEARQFSRFYKDLQSLTPKNSKVFAIIDAPYLVDFNRNKVHNSDIPGGASISPGMPFGQGSGALLEYLVNNGYNYILAVDFDNAVLQYTRKLMENNPKGEWYTRHGHKYGLDLMKNIDEIASGRLVAISGNTRLIKISD